MLNISGLNNGVVIDHIKAGEALNLYDYQKQKKYPGCVAIIKNAKSNKMGRKDIIKIEGNPEDIDLNMLAVVSESATINIIRGGILEEKIDDPGILVQHDSLGLSVVQCFHWFVPPCRYSYD